MSHNSIIANKKKKNDWKQSESPNYWSRYRAVNNSHPNWVIEEDNWVIEEEEGKEEKETSQVENQKTSNVLRHGEYKMH